jgi:DNA (cytosine-5)-methyltransferase 1
MGASVRTLSLFSGGGGLDLGVELALRNGAGLPVEGRAIYRGDSVGVVPVAYVEAEAFAASVLLSRMEEGALAPGPVWTDVATFDARPFCGLVDLVLGGSPCQDLSVAGKRAGLDGERSGLFWHFVRVVRECQPGLVFWENVGGAIGSLPRVFDAFAAEGYRGAAVSIRASDVGAPHRRQRVFLLAHRDGSARGHQPGRECGPRGAGAPEPGDAGEALAHGHGRGLALERSGSVFDGQRAPCGDAATGRQPRTAGRDMADAYSVSRDEGRALVGGRPPRGGSESRAGLGGEGGLVADASGAGLQGREWPGTPRENEGAPRPVAECGRPAWPPGPDDADGWAAYLAAGGPPPAQPRLCRGAHGVAAGVVDADSTWADRLRLLGNGVVPAQAAAAFTFLAAHLRGAKP